MDQISISPEVMEHARGALTFEAGETGESRSGVAAYQCKVYQTRLELESASDLTVTYRRPSIRPFIFSGVRPSCPSRQV